jgi:hypothetical protein
LLAPPSPSLPCWRESGGGGCRLDNLPLGVTIRSVPGFPALEGGEAQPVVALLSRHASRSRRYGQHDGGFAPEQPDSDSLPRHDLPTLLNTPLKP